MSALPLDVCPWNARFAQQLREPAFAAHEVLAGKDARTLAREVDGHHPDIPSVVGGAICRVGVAVIMYWPRAAVGLAP